MNTPVVSAVPSSKPPPPRLDIILTGKLSSVAPVGLVDAALHIQLAPKTPAGKLVLANKSYPLHNVTLAVTRSGLDRCCTPRRLAQVRADYVLRFSIDGCLHAARIVSANAWPGRCGAVAGKAPPVRLRSYELLVHRESTHATASTAIHTVNAACRPVNGFGPSCHLTARLVNRRQP